MQWTTDKPTVSGWYWVYVPRWYEREKPEVLCFYVAVHEKTKYDQTGLEFYTFEESDEGESVYQPEDALAFMGPIAEPLPPEGLNENTGA